MAVVKTIIAGLLALAGLGAITWGLLSTPSTSPSSPVTVGQVSLRPLPAGALAAAPAPGKATTQPNDDDPEPMKPLEPRDAGSKTPPPAVDAGTQGKGQPQQQAAAKVDAGVKPTTASSGGEGTLNLQATDTADVYVDGRKVGSSPVLGLKVKAGAHKVRFDCYDEAGNAVTGSVRQVNLNPDEDQEVSWTCAPQ